MLISMIFKFFGGYSKHFPVILHYSLNLPNLVPVKLVAIRYESSDCTTDCHIDNVHRAT